MMKQYVTCHDRLSGFSTRNDPRPDVDMRLIQRKNRGGLQTPCHSVVVICKSAECCIRRLEAAHISTVGIPYQKKLGCAIVSSVLHNAVNSGVTPFPELQQRMVESESGENYVVQLIKIAAAS